MQDIGGLREKIAKKRQIGSQQVARLIRKKEKETLFPQRLATLAVAADNGIGLSQYATSEELGQLRESRRIGVGPSAVLNLAPAPRPKQVQRVKGGRKAPEPKRSARSSAAPRSADSRARRVLVVHGRNEAVRNDVVRFLRALDLLPIPWAKAILEAGKGTPSISEILDSLFKNAVAVVVIMTPDDLVTLAKPLRKSSDAPFEKEPVGQARPNVFIEAGMAIARYGYKGTVILQVGKVKVPTDFDKHITRLTNSRESRHELMTKLKAAGCEVDTDGPDYLTEGDFERKELYE